MAKKAAAKAPKTKAAKPKLTNPRYFEIEVPSLIEIELHPTDAFKKQVAKVKKEKNCSEKEAEAEIIQSHFGNWNDGELGIQIVNFECDIAETDDEGNAI